MGAIGFAELFRVADQRLYDAKRQGRNRVLMDATPDLQRAASA